MEYTIFSSGWIQIVENESTVFISPNQALTTHNEIIEADPDFTKYRTQENADAYEVGVLQQRASESEKGAKTKMMERLTMIEMDKVRQLPDEQAVEEGEFFPSYQVGKTYEADDRFYYPMDEKLYKVLQLHTSAIEWKPNEAVSLYVVIQVATDGEYPDWIQPTGAHDSYQTGDIVMYNTQAWISKIDANTTVPDGDEPHNRYWEPYNI